MNKAIDFFVFLVHNINKLTNRCVCINFEEDFTMKKIIALVLMVAMLSVFLVSCGKSIVGSWEAEIEGMEGTITFEKDGTGTFAAAGMSLDITWEADGDKLDMSMSLLGQTVPVFEDAEFKVKGKTLTITYEGESVDFKTA